MPERYIEKTFLYLLCISVILHLGVFAALYYFPPSPPEPPKEPVFIDLQQMPELKTVQKPKDLQKIPEQKIVQKPKKQISPLLSDRQVKVERETAPREEDTGKLTSLAPPPTPQGKKQQRQPDKAKTGKAESAGRLPAPKQTEQKEPKVTPGSSAASLLRPRQQSVQQQPETPNLFPKTEKLARLEEDYRRKYEREVAEGESLILNTQETKLMSFFRRFENAVYGVWHYPNNAIPGEVTYLVTFNSSNGQVIAAQIIESSGLSDIDDAALKTIRSMGPLGALHKDFKKPEYKLFVTFIYGPNSRRISR